MKPHRLCMTHHLVLGYGIHKKLDVFVRAPARLLSRTPGVVLHP